MPKIFLIKKRLHEQQLGLQEGQEGLLGKGDPLCPGSPLDDGPIPLLSKKDKECVGKCKFKILLIYNTMCPFINPDFFLDAFTASPMLIYIIVIT